MSIQFEKTPVIWFPSAMLKARIAERQGDNVKPRTVERRAAFRYPCNLEAVLQPVGLRKCDCPWLGRARDISTGGIGIILGYRYAPGTFLSVELQNRRGNSTRTLVVRVIHATPLRFGGWQIGCAFTNKISEDEVRVFLS